MLVRLEQLSAAAGKLANRRAPSAIPSVRIFIFIPPVCAIGPVDAFHFRRARPRPTNTASQTKLADWEGLTRSSLPRRLSCPSEWTQGAARSFAGAFEPSLRRVGEVG